MIGELGTIPTARPIASVWGLPLGVYVETNERGKSQIGGLFASTQQPDPGCCWMAPDSRIRFLKARNTTLLDVTVFVNPDVPVYRRKPPFVRIALAGITLVTRDMLKAGSTRLTMRIPDRYRDETGPLELRITSSHFVPALEHMNGDTRELGLVLQEIDSH